MIFRNGEYEISADGEKITITKKALEKWRDHYNKVVREGILNNLMMVYYNGKSDALCEILKMFEPLEG